MSMPTESPSMWAPGGEDHTALRAASGDDTARSDTANAGTIDAQTANAETADGDGARDDREAGETTSTRPDPELISLFGDPASIRPLGETSITHRRRGIASADGGGETLDRRRRGSSDDVLVTLLAHPATAAAQALTGAAFSASRRLRVDLSTRRPERRDLVFDASLRTWAWHRRAARVRLYGSASRNVTVLTLTPRQAGRRPSRWFVWAGSRAMERVAARLAAEVEPRRWQPPTE